MAEYIVQGTIVDFVKDHNNESLDRVVMWVNNITCLSHLSQIICQFFCRIRDIHGRPGKDIRRSD